ncbi:NACHT domain-containing protein [Rhodospirillum centenum]|uniref:NACHT domain-containing protein n=1 Tax=Rhodospirillum centenum (strain ATCC 51521 / SW) TaxID=414684 RepID=B6IYS0_RHOCS|nr:hypothetical protein [Rhodospirillum centenum]ACJ01444.1 hypothetical protein RC1_4105 [Rhodospirillum centenum SW]
MNDSDDENSVFEAEVRRIARELFPKARINGPVIVDGRERDCVFNDGEVMHVIEATVSRRKDKATKDLEKSAELVKSLRRQHQDVNFKIWFITKREPSADQSAVGSEIKKLAKCPVDVCSFRTFSAKLVDASSYLSLRENHPFGSVRNPADDADYAVPREDYVQIDLLNFRDKSLVNVAYLPERMSESPGVYLLVGDFGAGKSMTMRYMYDILADKYMSGSTTTFPVYLNLRDHFGQSNPSEALLRHGNEIGFAAPNQLVAAWKAGHCHVFLDGFDELSSTRLVRGVGGLRAARREAMRLVHAFVSHHPRDTSIFVGGRQHYFDSLEELEKALGLPSNFVHLTLNEFTHEQVTKFLKGKGFNERVPNWLPSRPLLLGYLAIKGVLARHDPDISSLAREEGWDYLVDRICEREARQIDPISIDPHAVREFVERLASWARRTNSGRGPVHLNNIYSIFEGVFSMPPDEKASTLIFRMPGLTSASGQEDAREFIDDDYVDACRSGDIIRFIESPHDPKSELLDESTINMGDLGASLSAYKLSGATAKKLSAALDSAARRNAPCLSFDVLRVMQQINASYVGPNIKISDGFFSEYQISASPDLSKVTFSECYFNVVEIDEGANAGPEFVKCQIEKVVGCIGQKDLPSFVASSADGISKFEDEAQTNADILDLPMPMSTKVLMTILRKLFVQAGRGRRENAFYRGLDGRSKVYVPEILQIIEKMEFASPSKNSGPVVWFPNRSLARDAHEILQAPLHSNHPLAAQVRIL